MSLDPIPTDPRNFTHEEFMQALTQVTDAQLNLADRKNKAYGQAWCQHVSWMAIIDVLQIASRIKEMLKAHEVRDFEGNVVGFVPASVFQDPKLRDQLMDIANYAMYAQFFFRVEARG